MSAVSGPLRWWAFRRKEAAGLRPVRLEAQDSALSRHQQGFESPTGRQRPHRARYHNYFSNLRDPVSSLPHMSTPYRPSGEGEHLGLFPKAGHPCGKSMKV
jgi:hypothetical protein